MSMVLVRNYWPLNVLEDFVYHDILDDLLYCDCDPFGFTYVPVRYVRVPTMRIKEQEKEYILTMEVPGYTREEINIELSNNILNISSDRQDKEFCRSIEISGVAEGVSATLENGILTVHLPKIEVPPAKRIEITVPEEPKELEANETTPELTE